MPDKNELINQSRMLSIAEVIKMWPMSKQQLWRLSTTKDDSLRIPSYKIGRKRLYRYDELMWYLDNHKAKPNSGYKKGEAHA